MKSSLIITSAVGFFPAVSGLADENDSLKGSGDTYSLQLNTNTFPCNTAFTDNKPVGACWEQFIFAFDPLSCPFGNCDGNLYIQYWLIGYFSTYGTCPGTDIPSGGILSTDDWTQNGGSCFASSDSADTDYTPIQSLTSLSLQGAAGSGGECAIFDNGDGNGPWRQCVGQSVLNLYQNWNIAEFNVFGFASGSLATFNPGTSITVETDATQQGTNLPVKCSPVSFTAETNNLKIVSPCTSGPGTTPNSQGIIFTESTFDFSISATPSDDTVLRGQSGFYTVTITQIAGPTDPSPVALSFGNSLPGGGSIFSSNQVVAAPFGASVTLTVTTTVTGPLGTFVLTIQGSVGSLTHSTTVNLHIYDFTVTAVPTSQQILTTGSNNYTVTLSLVAGSSTFALPNIGLAVTNLPFGTTASFSQVSGTPIFSSILTITTSNAPNGTYTLTLTGTDSRTPEGGVRNTSLSLIVLTAAGAIPVVIGTLIQLHSSGVLSPGQAGSLIAKLHQAIDDLTENTPANPAACNVLNAFVNQVESYVSEGVLTQDQANSLLKGPLGIYAIMASVPC